MTTPAPNDDLVRRLLKPLDPYTTAAVRQEAAAALEAQAERISVLEQALDWQPIETAPKDGTPLLLGHATAVFSGWWSDEDTDTKSGGWINGVQNNHEEYWTYPATHWMPLPAIPVEGAR